MREHAALLIDYENFFLARENNVSKQGRQGYSDELVRNDLEQLLEFARKYAEDRRLVIRRAYADFNVRRSDGNQRSDYYLQQIPQKMMELGIAPVQVFRFSRWANKNAADIRMAMDATGQMSVGPGVDRFIIVSGDCDFIPLILELQRLGAEVAVIGVEGATNNLLSRYSDSFAMFEELVAARESDVSDSDKQLEYVGQVLREILQQRQVLQFAAIRPLLSQRLGRSFDLEMLGFRNMGDFLRENAETLGIAIRRAEKDWEVVHREPDNGDTNFIQLHTPGQYRRLLVSEVPKLHLANRELWLEITESLFGISSNRSVPLLKEDIQSKVREELTEQGIDGNDKSVDDVMFQVFSAGVYRSRSNPTQPSTFNWNKTKAVLAPEVDSAKDIRQMTTKYIVAKLKERMDHRYTGKEQIDVDNLCNLLLEEQVDLEQKAIIQSIVDQVNSESI